MTNGHEGAPPSEVRRPSTGRRTGGWVMLLPMLVAASLNACNQTATDPASADQAADLVRLEGPAVLDVGQVGEFQALLQENVTWQAMVTPDGNLCESSALPALPLPSEPCEEVTGLVATNVPVRIVGDVDIRVEEGTEDTDYQVLSSGRTNRSLLFAPHWTLPGQGRDRTFTVVAEVTYQVDGSGATPVSVPHLDATRKAKATVPVRQRPLETPAIVVGFTEEELRSRPNAGAFVMVKPSNGDALRVPGYAEHDVVSRDPDEACQQLHGLLGAINGRVQTVSSLAAFADFATGLGQLRDNAASPGAQNTKCLVADQVVNLRDIGETRPGHWFLGIGHLTPEDSIRSLLFVGPPGTTAHFFQDRGWTEDVSHNAGAGMFTITLGPAGYAKVDSLKQMVAAPDPSVLCVAYEPYWRDAQFRDQLSAIGFDPVRIRERGTPRMDCASTGTSTQALTGSGGRARTSPGPSEPSARPTVPASETPATDRPDEPPTDAPSGDSSTGSASEPGTGATDDGAPTVDITSPGQGEEFESTGGYYVDVDLSAVATDPEDGTPTKVTWTTTADEHGTGTASTRTLGDGYQHTARLHIGPSGTTVHTIRVSVTDAAGNTAVDEVTITLYYVPG